MIHLVYVSSATGKLGETDLLDLLEHSRRRNRALDLTGMLLYAGGNFFQVLEGEEKDVDEVYTSIVRDQRNHGHILMRREAIITRTFPEWSMGFRHLSHHDIHGLKGYTEFLDRKMAPGEFANKADIVIDLLYQFRQYN